MVGVAYAAVRWLRATERHGNFRRWSGIWLGLERICRTAETVAAMKYGVLRPIACRRRFRVIRACAVDTHDGEVESEGYERPAQLERHPDIRA